MGDQKGAEEMLALALVQWNKLPMGGGPTSLFASRPASTNPRLRAFAPLRPAEWAANALSYVNEERFFSGWFAVAPGEPGTETINLLLSLER